MNQKIQVAIIEDQLSPGDWRIEEIGLHGECYIAIFCGPQAKVRAEEYLKWRYS